MTAESEDAAENAAYWIAKAQRERAHVASHPDCFDMKDRLQLAEMYERFASEETAGVDTKSHLLHHPV